MDVNQIYDKKYAESYDDRFLKSEYSRISSEFELSYLEKAILNKEKWLDVGCGTGYFLSHFQQIERCGIDLSSEMLKIARQRNNGVQFIEGDFREILKNMDSKWDLVSCMWYAYIYLDSMNQFDEFLMNLVKVTSIGGDLFIPVVDLEDLRPHTIINYEMKEEVHGGNVYLTSSTWTWVEEDGRKTHKHMISPQIDYFIDSLNGLFEQIEVIRYPTYMPGWVSRKAIVATGKLEKSGVSKIINCQKEDKSESVISKSVFENITTSLLFKELIRRLFSFHK